MAGSTYSTNLKIELMTTGENSGTWGDITNTNLGTALEQAVIGLGNPDYVSDANLTISITNSNAAQPARALVLNVTSTFGSLTATRELVVPTIQKQYIVQNNTTGGQSITVKTSAGTGITVPNGRKAHLYVNGTSVIQMFDFINILGGTIDNTTLGATTASSARVTTLNASGATTLDGTVALGNAAGDLITVPGTINSNLIFTDNTYDIGATGATRPRNLFLAGAATIGGNLSVGGTLTLTGGVNLNGNVTVGDSAADTLTINSTVTSNLIFTDNTYDIGASGATRPRNLFIAGNITAGGNQTLTGTLTVDSTTDSSSTTTGSIQTDGGVGIAKALYVGTTANIASTLTAGAAVTFDTTGAAINIGTSQTTGTLTLGGAAQTSTQNYSPSTKTYGLNLGAGSTESGATKTIAFGTGGVSGSTTNITIGSVVANASSVAIYKYLSIGATTQTAYGLNIETDVGPQIRSLRPDTTENSETYHFQFARGNGTGNLITMTTTADGSNGVKKLLWLNSATGSYPLAVTKDGYTGINNSIPATWLHVVGTDNASRGQMTIQSTAANVNPRLTFWYGGGSPSYNLDIYGDTAASNAVYDSGVGYGHKWSVNGSTKLQLNTNAILAMNGATAQSWGTYTSGGILQLDNGGYIVGLDGNATQIGTNGYYNGSNWTYVATGGSANINMDTSGAIYLRTAPSGTAGTSMQSAFNYNLTLFNNGSGTTGTNSFGDSGQNGYPLYIRGFHVSGYGGVYFNSVNTAYYCTRSDDNTAGQGLRILDASNGERARVSVEPTTSQFEVYVGNDYPIKFFTNGTQRWTIDNSATSGNLIANSANIGIKFNKSGAFNNQVLNDYEYGTWSPTMGDASNDFTMTESNGSYVKVGRMVYVVGIISWSNKGSASSASGVRIKNLPFPVNSDVTNTRVMGMFGAWFATNTNWYTYNTYEGGNVSSLGIEGKNSLTGSSVTLAVSDVSTNTSCRFSLTYYANS